MSENLQGPACTQAEYEAAQKAGMLILTTAKEREIHAFAELIREEQQARIAELERQKGVLVGALQSMLIAYDNCDGHFHAAESGRSALADVQKKEGGD